MDSGRVHAVHKVHLVHLATISFAIDRRAGVK
jgi:hypothetical protein